MSNIGIMSMQRIINYGSFLQAYGLKSIIEELGHEVQFVDYHIGEPLIKTEKQRTGVSRKIEKVFEVLSYDAPLKHKIRFILYKKQFPKRYHQFLSLTSKPNYTPELDTLLIGSDEVFNCIQQNTNVGYSLELFGENNKANKIITYAASFGNTTLEKLKQYHIDNEIGQLLKQIDVISVRDRNTAQIIENLTGKKACYHLDPVLSYDFIRKCNRIPQFKIKEKYLILYAYSGRISSLESEWISTYARNRGLKIYAIGGVQKCADKYINCSPFEVFSYFQNAEEVITDTYHGTIFSVVTQRQFATVVRKSEKQSYGNEEKLNDLLVRLGLRGRGTYTIDKVASILEEKIDYKQVENVLSVERLRTQQYLSQHLVKESEDNK